MLWQWESPGAMTVGKPWCYEPPRPAGGLRDLASPSDHTRCRPHSLRRPCSPPPSYIPPHRHRFSTGGSTARLSCALPQVTWRLPSNHTRCDDRARHRRPHSRRRPRSPPRSPPPGVYHRPPSRPSCSIKSRSIESRSIESRSRTGRICIRAGRASTTHTHQGQTGDIRAKAGTQGACHGSEREALVQWQ